MQDNFKELVGAHNEEFEFPFDADKGWKDFQSRQPKKKQKRVWLVAASVSILAMTISIFVWTGSQNQEPLSEWQEVELFYQAQIEGMTQLVANHSDDESVLYDLEEMDRAFAEVKEDLKDDAANEEVIEAMMNHYRLKLEILERMLEEIKEENEDVENNISL